MKERKPSEDVFRKNIQFSVVLSPFITLDENGEVIFYPDPPCPRCDFWMGGEFSGIFQCEVCGWSPLYYCDNHGYSYLLEGTWKILRHFIPYKRLRWEVSRLLYHLYSVLKTWYLKGRHQITITSGNYYWNWNEKKWKRLYGDGSFGI